MLRRQSSGVRAVSDVKGCECSFLKMMELSKTTKGDFSVTSFETDPRIMQKILYKFQLVSVFFAFFFRHAAHSLFTSWSPGFSPFSISISSLPCCQALHLPPPCLFGGNASPKEVAFAHILRARAVCQMEEAPMVQWMGFFSGWNPQRMASFFGQESLEIVAERFRLGKITYIRTYVSLKKRFLV